MFLRRLFKGLNSRHHKNFACYSVLVFSFFGFLFVFFCWLLLGGRGDEVYWFYIFCRGPHKDTIKTTMYIFHFCKHFKFPTLSKKFHERFYCLIFSYCTCINNPLICSELLLLLELITENISSFKASVKTLLEWNQQLQDPRENHDLNNKKE